MSEKVMTYEDAIDLALSIIMGGLEAGDANDKIQDYMSSALAFIALYWGKTNAEVNADLIKKGLTRKFEILN